MTIAHCPKCREQVSVPTGVSRQARVRCPLCLDEYLLDDALRPLPPLLLVLHDPEATPVETALAPDEPAPVFTGAESSRGPAVAWNEPEPVALEPAAPSVPAFQFEPGSGVATARVSASRESKGSSRRRARRKHSSPFRLMVQTIGGGVMGLVIAQLILWWMPGKWDLNNRDPFKLATKVALYAPFLVPATLHGSASSAVEDSPLAAPFTDFTNAAAPADKTQDESPPRLNTQLPDFALKPNAPTESAPPAAIPVAPKSEQELANENPPEKLVRLREPPVTKLGDVTDRLADFIGADVAWDTANAPTREEKIRLITAIYDALAVLGEATAVLDQDELKADEAMQAVSEKLQSFVSQASKMAPIGTLGGRALGTDQDHGAAWYGTVKAHRSRGNAYETELVLLDKSNSVVAVISAQNLSESLPVGTRVLILGRRVADPVKDVVGYEGDAKTAMYYGIHALAPSQP